jgi:hypothetical protein
MTKPTELAPTKTTAAAPLPSSASPPAELLDKMAADAGRGVSQKAEDQLIPLIYILQQNSPQVDKRGPEYIEDAEPGHFYLPTARDQIRDGEKGIVVIPSEMVRSCIEWQPQRRGFVARHDAMPTDTESRVVQDVDGSSKRSLVRPNGNIVVDTREFYVVVEGRPYLLPCYSTRHKFARAWQSYFHNFQHPKTGGMLPSFARQYRLTTGLQDNAMGRWFGLKFEDLGWVSAADYARGRALSELVASGAQRVEAPINGGA